MLATVPPGTRASMWPSRVLQVAGCPIPHLAAPIRPSLGSFSPLVSSCTYGKVGNKPPIKMMCSVQMYKFDRHRAPMDGYSTFRALSCTQPAPAPTKMIPERSTDAGDDLQVYALPQKYCTIFPLPMEASPTAVTRILDTTTAHGLTAQRCSTP